MDMYIDPHGIMSDGIEQLKRETTVDPTLALAYEFILKEGADSRRHIRHMAQRYWDQCYELITDHGILMTESRIVICTSQQE